jgi:RNA polymerase sigma factor (sigma-70 family)
VVSESPAATLAIERIFREQYGRTVAVLVRYFGDIELAEEAVHDAFAVAVQRWPDDGLPASPAGWIITTARNRAINRLRREASRQERHIQAARLQALHERDDPPEEAPSAVPDDRLRLIFTCCHPALGTGVQVALTLRFLGGLTTAEIARAFLVPEATMAQRLLWEPQTALLSELSVCFGWPSSIMRETRTGPAIIADCCLTLASRDQTAGASVGRPGCGEPQRRRGYSPRGMRSRSARQRFSTW